MNSPKKSHYCPARWQHGWLRWPVAWSLAMVITLAMLAVLATITQPWQRPPAIERLAVALHPPAEQAAPPPTKVAAPHKIARASAATPAQNSVATPILTTEAPALQTAPTLPTSPALMATPVAPSSTSTLSAGQGAATLSNTVNIAGLPLKQRCMVQIKPDFPSRARKDDIEQGRVLARLNLDAQGRVSDVTILEASPGGYFEAASREAALQWRCLPSGQAGDSVRVPFVFAVE
jgi:protein TonB